MAVEENGAPRILILRRDNIGDLVCTTPLLEALRAQLPGAWLAALVTTYNAEVLKGNPALDAIFVYEKLKHRTGGLYAHLKSRMPTIKPTPRLPLHTDSPTLDRIMDWSLNSVRSIANEVHLYGSGTVNVPWRFSRKPLDDFGVIEVTSSPTQNAKWGDAISVESPDSQIHP